MNTTWSQTWGSGCGAGCEQAANRLPPSRGDVEFAVPRPPSLLDRPFPPRGGRGIVIGCVSRVMTKAEETTIAHAG